MEKIQMVDLKGQYLKIKTDVDAGIQQVIDTTTFINGPAVKEFSDSLSQYLGGTNVIPCANGTDALQVALMALELQPGDEVIVPCFTYVATAEVIALLGLVPVLTEVDPHTFNITATAIEKAITAKTKAVVPVHLYGQCADMERIMAVAKKYGLFVVEDTAQAIGSDYTFSDGTVKKAGTIGDIGCTSFFPSKNLGCYGDGGAIFTNDAELAKNINIIANHGQSKKYYHAVVGCNSRLDTLQAAILSVKLQYLDDYVIARNKVASAYDNAFGKLDWLKIPLRQNNSTHVFHQYTLQLKDAKVRDKLKTHLADHGIPSMIYYPFPLHLQQAYKDAKYPEGSFPISEDLCNRVLSLPIHTEMTDAQLETIINAFSAFK